MFARMMCHQDSLVCGDNTKECHALVYTTISSGSQLGACNVHASCNVLDGLGALCKVTQLCRPLRTTELTPTCIRPAKLM